VDAPFHSATPTTPTTSLAPSGAEIIEHLKQQLDATTRHLNVTSQQLDTTTRQLDVTSERLQLSELRVQLLEEKLRLQRIAKYGPGSEKLTSQQLELLEFEPGTSNLEVAAEGTRDALPATPDKKKRKHPGRQTLPANLPRVERVIVCTSEQCVCGGYGQATTVIGYEESEQLDVEPVKYFVLVTRREKRACKRCEERGVMAAPLPPRIIEKSLVSDRVIVDAIVGKYSNHCPLYRQSVILQRSGDRRCDCRQILELCWLRSYVTFSLGRCVNRGHSWNGSSHKCRLDLGKEGHQIMIIAPVLF
jgi:transposase